MSADPPTVAGLPIVGMDDRFTPLAALVVIRGLNEEGAMTYWARATEGLDSVQALGMAYAAIERLRAQAGEDVA